MTRRTRLTLALVTAILVLLALLPGHPAVRTPVVERLSLALAEAGVTLRYGEASGNLWRGLRLDDVALQADGVDVHLERLDLRWFLPPLVTGELPLRLRLHALEGDLDVERALAALAGDGPERSSGLPTPRLLWQEVMVEGADLRVAGVPFTLPDVSIEELSVSGSGGDVGFAATLRTAEGQVPVVGRIDPTSGALALEAIDADLRVGRHWWDGIEGGRLHGTLTLERGRLRVDANVERGAIVAFGASVDGIRGPVRYDGREVHAELDGRTLDGTIDAVAVVDVAAQHWLAHGTADVDMAALTPLLWALGAAGAPPSVDGRAVAVMRASGWSAVTLEIDADVDADVYGAQARGLATEVRYGPQELRVRSSGELAGGALELELSSTAGIVDVAAELSGARVGPLQLDELAGSLRLGAEQSGTAAFSGSLDVAGGVPLRGDLSLDADAAVLYLESDEVQGVRVIGAAAAPALAGDAPLEGRLRIELPDEWWSGAAPSTELVLSGTLTQPRAQLEVTGATPARLRADPWLLDADLRGAVELTLEGGVVALDGRLGPVALAGAIGDGGELALDVDALDVVGPTQLRTPPLALLLVPSEGGWAVRDRAGRLSAELADGGWQLAVDAFELRVAGLELVLAGEARGEGTTLDAALRTGDLDVDVRLDAGRLDATIAGRGEVLTVGGDANGWRLGGALDLEALGPLAAVDPPPRGRLAGDLLVRADGAAEGALTLQLEAPVDAQLRLLGDDAGLRVEGEGTVAAEEVRLRGRLTPELSLEGDVGPFGPIRFDGRAGGGSGETPAMALGPLALEAQPWTLTFELPDARAELRWGDSVATLDWRDQIGVSARIAQRVGLPSGASLEVVGDAAWSAADPGGALDLRLLDGVDATLLSLRGGLLDAQLAGDADAARWSALLGEQAVARGALRWDGRVALLEAHGEAELHWTLADGRALRASAAFDDAGLRWDVTADGLVASGDASSWQAAFDAFDPGAWLESPVVAATLDGALAGGDAWRGDVAFDVTAPLPFQGDLRGDGDALTLLASARPLDESLTIDLEGRWDGALDATLRAAPGADAPELLAGSDATLRLRFDADGLRGDGALALSAATLGPLAWPALEAQLTLRDGRLRLEGPGGAWASDGGVGEGRWSHPLFVAGVEHALVVDADAAEPLTLRGPLLTAGASVGDAAAFDATALDAWRVSLSADDARPLLEAIVGEQPGDLLALRGLTATLTPATDPADGVHLTLASRWRPSEAFDLPVTLEATGTLADASGRGTIGEVGTPRAALSLALSDGAVSLDADVDGLGPALTLALRSDADGWSVDAREREGEWAATAAASARDGVLADVSLRGPDTALGGTLTDAATLALTGDLLGRETTIDLGGDANDLTLRVRWGDDDATLRYRAEGAELTLAVAGARLDLAGPDPTSRLDGTLAWGDDELALSLLAPDAHDARWRARIEDGLTLALEGEQLRLVGTAQTRVSSVLAHFDGDLLWGLADGFAGSGRLGLRELPGAVSVEAHLAGERDLAVRVDVAVDGGAVGGALGTLAADPRDGWQLDIDLEAPLAGSGIDAWRLALSGRASGGPAATQLDTALALVGPVAAHGRLWLDAGALRADLVGQSLSASARLDDAGGRAQLQLDDADVGAWLPWLATPRLSLGVDARTVDGGLEAIADGVRLRLPNGAVSGQGRLDADGRLGLTLRSDVDLADVRVGPGLQGRLTGPVTVTSDVGRIAEDTSLAGVLVLEGGRVEGVDGRFDGDVQVTGPASDPRVSLALLASDGADGTLRATLRPADASARLDADLSVAGVRLVLRSEVAPEVLRADGRLVVGATHPIEIRSRDGGVTLGRSGDPEAFHLELRRDPWQLALRADLASLDGGVAGQLGAVLAWHDGVWPALAGELTALELLGVPLGDWSLDSDPQTDTTWRAAGDAGAFALDLDTLRWSGALEPLALPLGDDPPRLRLDLEGEADAVRLELQVDGAAAGESVELRLAGAVDLGAGTAELHLDGALAGGRVTGTAARTAADGWRGALQLRDATLQGRALRADVRVDGADWLPDFAGDALVDGLLDVQARYADAQLGVALGVETPAGRLVVDGDVWPRLALGVSAANADGDTLWLEGSLDDPDAPLVASGSLRLALGPLALALRGDADGAILATLGSPLLDAGALAGRLPPAPLLDGLERLGRDGLRLSGVDGVSGSVRVATGPEGLHVDVDALELGLAGVRLALDGEARGLDTLALTLRAEPPDLDTSAAWWPRGLALDAPLVADLALTAGRLTLESAAPWPLLLEVDLAAREGSLRADLVWSDGGDDSAVRADLRLTPSGLGGQVDLQGLRFGGDGRLPLRLDGRMRGADAELDLDLQLRSARSAASLRGRLPLDALPFDPGTTAAPRPASVDLRIAALDLRDLPGIDAAVPYLEGVVSGSVVVRGDQVAGQLVASDARLAQRSLPLVATVAGDLSLPSLDVRLETTTTATGARGVAASSASLAWDGERFEGLVRLERFPVHALVEAVVGPSDVSTEVTGVLRAGWSPQSGEPLDLRVATEHVRLERAGVVTVGLVAFDLSDGALRIQEASFEGRGAWRASGEVRPERIDIELVAEDADFGPLLGLVPALARYAVGAEGDLQLRGTGTLAQPQLSLSSERLRVDVAGTSYELRDADARLEGERLSLDAALSALAPLEGAVTVRGDGRLRLAPFELGDLSLRLGGDLDVPLVGRITDVEGTLERLGDASTALRIDGVLGAPFTIEGSLTPLDLTVRGRGLQLAVPQLFIGESVLDADLRVRLEDTVRLSGRVDAASVRIDLGARAATAVAPGDAPTPSAAELAARRAALELVTFDGVRVVAPQRVTLSETLGSGEAAFDLTLTGSAAEPPLAGTATALRGTLRFSGRDFELVRAVAQFEPTRGVLPRVSVEARSQFEKSRVLVPGSTVTFAAPPGPRFEVRLAFDADVITGADGELTLDLVPRLSSDASIELQTGTNGLTAGARPLTDLELLGLIALGRLEPGGGGTFAGAVAQTALDTAVDLLVVSELQAALSEALGIDLVEIRTSALTDLLGGADDPFSVSLRFGGYLSDELFASYRVGTFDDAERAFAFTNELVLTYDLGPVAFDLSGSLDFPVAGTGQPVPGVSAAVRYDISRSFALEAGVELGSERQTARLGVTLRW